MFGHHHELARSTPAIESSTAPTSKKNKTKSTLFISLQYAVPVLMIILLAGLVHRLLNNKSEVASFPDFDLLTPHDLNSDLSHSNLLLDLNESEAMNFTTHIESFIGFDLKYPYGETDQAKDKEYIVRLLLHIYKYNYIDRCKLDSLLNDFPALPKFTFLLTSDDRGGLASYYPFINSILLPPMIHLKDPVVTAQYFSHELRHAIDAYNNIKKGICINKLGRLTEADAFIFGSGADCNGDTQDRKRVTKLIHKDIARIEKMYLSLLNPGKSDYVELDILLELIKKYNYKKIFTAGELEEPNKQLNIQNIQRAYRYDKVQNSYVPGDKFLGEKLEIQPLAQKHKLTRYYTRYNLMTHQMISFLTHPDEVTLRDLAKDLLMNILMFVNEVKTQPAYNNEYSFTHETAAFLDMALGPYSHKLANTEKTLKEWLLPELSAHQLKRATTEVKECFAGSYRKR
jgi:hypothetical protein